MDDDYKYARPIGGHHGGQSIGGHRGGRSIGGYQSTQGSNFSSARPDSIEYIQRMMEEEEEEEYQRIHTDPQAASATLEVLLSDFRDYEQERRFNYDGFYVESNDGTIRSKAERDRFYDVTKAHLDSYKARVNDIPAHGDPEMERKKATMVEGIKVRHEQLKDERSRYD